MSDKELPTNEHGHYAAAMSLGGHLAAIHAKAGWPVHLSLVKPEVRATSDEARRLAAELICAAEVADEPVPDDEPDIGPAFDAFTHAYPG